MTSPTVTVRCYKYNGPYWEPTIGSYSAARLKELIFHVRLAMEDDEDIIAIYHDDRCIGLWEADNEPEPDGEGGWFMPRGYYALRRPGGHSPRAFEMMADRCRGKG